MFNTHAKFHNHAHMFVKWPLRPIFYGQAHIVFIFVEGSENEESIDDTQCCDKGAETDAESEKLMESETEETEHTTTSTISESIHGNAIAHISSCYPSITLGEFKNQNE